MLLIVVHLQLAENVLAMFDQLVRQSYHSAAEQLVIILLRSAPNDGPV
jgi:hypothetical protein